MVDLTSAVDAAARAIYEEFAVHDRPLFEGDDVPPDPPWGELGDKQTNWREAVVTAVHAAAPHIAAQALRKAAEAFEAVKDYTPTEYDQGRVDQRHEDTAGLLGMADRYAEEF